MSAIGSVSGSGLDITQLLQRLACQQCVGGENTTKAPSPPPGGAPPEGFQDQLGQVLTAAGVSEEETATILDEVKSAIAAALQDQNGSYSRDAVQIAIDDTLKAHGLDPDEIRTQFQSLFGAPDGPGGPGGGPPPGGPPSSQETDKEPSTQTGSAASATDAKESAQDLLAKLLSSGNKDDLTLQILQSLLPLLDTTA